MKNDPAGFNAFEGVFTPCVLTILGAILFLRFGYVVGNSGIIETLLILVICKVITLITALSLSAVISNTPAGGGGAYYIISRSLGVEFGGAIGIFFFFALSAAIALHVIGFAESVLQLAGGWNLVLVALITNFFVFLCVFIGAGWTLRIQYFILATLGVALFSFFYGGLADFDSDRLRANLRPAYLAGENVFTMFALFFPAVTGIMAGANMSGDLRDPQRAIPKGTIAAILVTALLYAIMLVVLAAARPLSELSKNNEAVFEISPWPALITLGVFAATLSSALGAMMGAPRILAALARDNIFPSFRPLGLLSGKNREPRVAIVITFLLSSLLILAGDLNTIAPLITMSFMLTYGLINLATFYEGVTKNPSYRPTFRYSHWSISFLGALICGAVMLLIDWRWALASLIAMAGIYFFIFQKEVEARWGDLNSGLLIERTRKNLLKLETMLYHPKNWRPIILAISGSNWKRPDLAILGHWLTSGHGILNLGLVVVGDLKSRTDRISNHEALMSRFVAEERLEAFPNVVAAPSVNEGIEYLIQCSGIGAIRPNTLLISWPSRDKAESLGATLRSISELHRNIIVSKFDEPLSDRQLPPEGYIDVWWRGRQNGELMLLLAHLLRENNYWRSRTIRLMRVVAEESGRESALQHFYDLARVSRINIEPDVIVSTDPQQAIADKSRDAAVVFLGFQVPEEGKELEFFDNMENFSAGLKRVILVDSVENVKLEY